MIGDAPYAERRSVRLLARKSTLLNRTRCVELLWLFMGLPDKGRSLWPGGFVSYAQSASAAQRFGEGISVVGHVDGRAGEHVGIGGVTLVSHLLCDQS